jgi:hypothetical protein
MCKELAGNPRVTLITTVGFQLCRLMLLLLLRRRLRLLGTKTKGMCVLDGPGRQVLVSRNDGRYVVKGGDCPN